MSRIQSGVNNGAPSLSVSLAPSIDRLERGARNTLPLVFYACRKQLPFNGQKGERGKDRENTMGNERTSRPCVVGEVKGGAEGIIV